MLSNAPDVLLTWSRLLRLLHGGPSRGMVAMIHIGRCGSKILADAIGQHPDVRWSREIFERVRQHHPGFRPERPWIRAVIEADLSKRPSRYYGFETKTMQIAPHCIAMSPGEYVNLLREIGFDRFVLLTRRNVLRVLVSAVVAKETGEYHVRAAPKGATKVHIDVTKPLGVWAGSLLEVLQWFEDSFELMLKATSDVQRLTLTYEDDISQDLGIAYGKLCRFLDIEVATYTTRFTRTNPYPLNEIIDNHHEVCGALSGTRFEWMLC